MRRRAAPTAQAARRQDSKRGRASKSMLRSTRAQREFTGKPARGATARPQHSESARTQCTSERLARRERREKRPRPKPSHDDRFDVKRLRQRENVQGTCYAARAIGRARRARLARGLGDGSHAFRAAAEQCRRRLKQSDHERRSRWQCDTRAQARRGANTAAASGRPRPGRLLSVPPAAR
ncbi:hypothetical protein PsYK624_151820 [Phanerochaete sordida]|uniref:Uncharacterized protein n=1 Tax=Phanerochaete sordida TaxID=48140 RepID=A0A9P3GSZ8_9APHY|nr:hypothetical protein PsYK624_151820 [Phanerochaete sordida]